MLRRPKPTKVSGLSFEHVGICKRGPTLSMDVPAGSTIAIMGPAGSGKSRLLRVIAGLDKPVRGEVSRAGDAILLGGPTWTRRDTPMSIARQTFGKGSLQRATDAISSLGLWEARQKPCSEMSPGQQAASEFIPALLGSYSLIGCDHRLDLVDAQTLESLWANFQLLRREGAILVYTTYRPDLGERADFVLAMKNEAVAFSGSPESLRRTTHDTVLVVATNNQPGVRAIADAFEVEISETPDGLRMAAKDGQALAAKLLLEGYGDVKFIVQKSPTLAEALLRINSI